jgi:glutaredoxin-dependent peroxiredoxin
MPSIGEKAPSFTLFDTARATRSLEEFAGKKTVIAFFPAAFTGVCEKELCSFRDSMSELNTLDAQVVAISADAPFANGAFAERNGIQFPVLSDYDRVTINAYDVAHPDFAGMPGYTAAKRSVFILDKEGVVRYKWVSENPGVEPDYAEIKTELGKM